MMKWTVVKETIFVQTVVRISFLPHSRRVQRWNYEAVKEYHCIVATEKGLPPISPPLTRCLQEGGRKICCPRQHFNLI